MEMKISDLIARLQRIQRDAGDIFVETGDVSTLLGVDTSKVPAMFCMVSILQPKQNADGSFTLPGRDELARLNLQAITESMQGLGGNVLTVVGFVDTPITFTNPPIQPPTVIITPPPIISQAPTLTWPIASATNQQVINAINKEFGGFGIIPADILADMVFKDEALKLDHRKMLYKDLKTARALENWNLPPNVLERVKKALKEYNPSLF